MTASAETPILVGVGQVLQRFDDPLEGAEPLAMMIDALESAERDAGVPGLLSRAESIYVVQGMWRYRDPGREIARRVGASEVETISTPFGGNFSQACVSDAAVAIRDGRRRVALVTGAENGRSHVMARRQGAEIRYSEAPGQPDRSLATEKPMSHPAELTRGLKRATEMYSLFENAIRYARGESIDAHRERISELWASFNRVAQNNPHAWIRKPYRAEEIATASPDNPMIGFPYPRLMNSNSRVDMGAGLIMCSTSFAKEVGIPEEKWVYLQAATEANDAPMASQRQDFHSSPAIRIAGGRALELAGKSVEEIDHFDLYSCFPSAVQVSAKALGIPADRTLTVTGGLTFGGGPMNDYVLHSIARMIEVLREDAGSTGLVTANGGFLTKHAFGVYSTIPPEDGFRFENLQEQVDALPLREVIADFEGPVTIESYTVMFKGPEPDKGFAACLTEDGVRTWALVRDPAVLLAMTREEFCGREARLDGAGSLAFD